MEMGENEMSTKENEYKLKQVFGLLAFAPLRLLICDACIANVTTAIYPTFSEIETKSTK